MNIKRLCFWLDDSDTSDKDKEKIREKQKEIELRLKRLEAIKELLKPQ